jgi:hypothetical protein
MMSAEDAKLRGDEVRSPAVVARRRRRLRRLQDCATDPAGKNG